MPFTSAARFWLEQDEKIVQKDPPKAPVRPSRLMRKLSEGSMKGKGLEPRSQPPVSASAPSVASHQQQEAPVAAAGGAADAAGAKLAPKRAGESKRSSILSKSPFGKRKKSKKEKSSSGISRSRAISTPVALAPVSRKQGSPLAPAASSNSTSMSMALSVENVSSRKIAKPELSQRPKRGLNANPLQNIISELIDTERDYLLDLRIIEEVFYGPIEKLQLLSSLECGRLFSCIRDLVPVHTRLLERFEAAEKQNPKAVNVGRCFIEEAEHLKIYESYCVNQPRALETFAQLEKSNEPLMSYLSVVYERPECRGLDLNAFLIKPLQRICKYPLLIRELVKQTPPLPLQPYEDLATASDKVVEIVTAINESKRESEEFEELIMLQRRVQAQTSKVRVGIIDANRKLVRKGELVVVTKSFKKVPVLYFLFNDLLLLTKPSYKLHAFVPLAAALVNPVTVHDAPYCLEVVHAGTEKLWLSLASEEELDAVFDLLSVSVDKLLEEQRTALAKQAPASPIRQSSSLEDVSKKPLPRPPGSPLCRVANGKAPPTPEKPRRFSMPPKADADTVVQPGQEDLSHLPSRSASARVPPAAARPEIPTRSSSTKAEAREGSNSPVKPLVPPRTGLVALPGQKPVDRASYRQHVKTTLAVAHDPSKQIAIQCSYEGKELQVLLPIDRKTYFLFRQRLCRQLKTFAFAALAPDGTRVKNQATLDAFLAAGDLRLDCSPP